MVADREHLLELVADEDDGDTLVAQAAQQREQRVGLVRGQGRGRLVHQEDARAQGQGLGDLDQLHLRAAQPRHRQRRVDVEIQQIQPALRLGPHLGIVDPADRTRPQPLQHDVLGHREARDQVALLVDDADPGGDRRARIGEANRAAIEQQLARIGLVDAGQDLDQGGLAGTVLAQQRVDRAARRAPG